MSDSYWEQPIAWDRQAARTGNRPRVFCASTADWADDEAPAGQRDRLFELIRKTPRLDWLLLTKRAKNISKYLPKDWGENGYPNVWLALWRLVVHDVGHRCAEHPRRRALRLGLPVPFRQLSPVLLAESAARLALAPVIAAPF
jgi:protein gp37